MEDFSGKWFEQKGNADEAVLSSRIRLARNIDGLPFPVRLNMNRRAAVNSMVYSVLEKSAVMPLRFIDMSKLYPYEAVSLAERHLISPEFVSGSEGRALLLSDDERISIMLNEEDHIRIQSIESGLSLEKAYDAACVIDDVLSGEVGFAFDNRLGFLNQNPQDIGTGLRASVMLHLPALSKTGEMSRFASTVKKLGYSVRGFHGDGTAIKGDIYRISNQVSLGISEAQAVSNLKSLVMQLATRERAAAEEFIKDIGVKDRINRAMGLLSNAVLLTSDEMMDMLSWVRLGAVHSLVKVNPEALNVLFITMQPACVNVIAGTKLSSAERDEFRAKAVKECLCQTD